MKQNDFQGLEDNILHIETMFHSHCCGIQNTRLDVCISLIHLRIHEKEKSLKIDVTNKNRSGGRSNKQTPADFCERLWAMIQTLNR